MDTRTGFPESMEAQPKGAEASLERYLNRLASSIDSLQRFLADEYRKSKIDVDDFTFQPSATSVLLQRNTYGRVRYANIIVDVTGQTSVLTIGPRRRYNLAAGMTVLPGPFVVDFNEDITVTPAAAADVMVEANGVMIPNPARGVL